MLLYCFTIICFRSYLFCPSTNAIHRRPRKVQLRGIGIRRNGGGLVWLAFFCFGNKITKKETALQENLCTHLGHGPNECVKKSKRTTGDVLKDDPSELWENEVSLENCNTVT